MKRNFKSFFIISIFLFAVSAAARAQTVYTWTGNVNDAWGNNSNWKTALNDPAPNFPNNSSDDVVIPNTTLNPKISNDVSINSLTINSGTLTLTGNATLTLSGNFTNNGTFTAGTNNTVTLSPSGNAVTITGISSGSNPEDKTKFHNLKLQNGGGKTLTIDGKISVNGILKLEGTSAGSLLTIAGGTNSPGIKLSTAQANGKWLKVKSNIPMIPESGGKAYTVTESKAEEVSGFLISDEHPKNWIFSSYAGNLTWKGTYSSNWNDWQNWQPYGTPGVNSIVTIATTTHSYPKLTGNVSAQSVTVAASAELDLAGYVIKKASNATAQLTCSGTLKLTGTTAQEAWFTAASSNRMTVTNTSTVEYNAGSTGDVWPGPYAGNLILNRSINTTDGTLKVNKRTTVASDLHLAATLETHDLTVNTASVTADTGITVHGVTNIDYSVPVTITSPAQLYEDNITFSTALTFNAATSLTAKKNLTGSTSPKKDITFTGGNVIVEGQTQAGAINAEQCASFTVENSVSAEDNITVKNFNIKTASVSARKITVNEMTQVTVPAVITTSSVQEYKGSVTLSGQTTFNTTYLLHFLGAVSGTGSMIIPGNGTVSIQNSILLTGPASKFEHTGTGGITVQSASNPPTPITIQAATQTYNRAVTIQNTDTVFTAGTSVTFKADVSAPAKTLTFNGNGTVTAQQNLNAGSVNAQNTSKLIISGNTVLDSDLTAKELETAGSVTAGNINVADNWQSAAGTISANDIAVGQNWPTAGIITAKGNVRVIGTFTQTGSSSELKFEGNNLQTLRVGSTSQIRYLKNAANLRLNSDITITDTFENNAVSPRIFDHNGKTVTFTGSPSKITGTSEPTFFHLTIAVGAGLKLDRATVKISRTFTNNGTFSHNNKEVIFNGLTSQIAGSTETSFYNLTVDDNKILHLGQNIIVAAVLKNKGIFKALGKTVTLNPAGTDIKIQGTDTATDTEFASVSCLGAGGKTLTINNKIKAAALNLSGSSAASPLIVKGPGEITLDADDSAAAPTVPLPSPPPAGYFLNVCLNIPIADGRTYTVRNSKPANNSGTPITSGSPKNWIFEDYSGPLTWTAGADFEADKTKWNNPKNWSPNCTPGIDTDVTIPVVGTGKYPALSTSVKTKTVTVNSGAQLNLAGSVINDNPGGTSTSLLTNNGTLKMTGTIDQKAWFESTDPSHKIDLGTDSTVEYTGNVFPTNIYDGNGAIDKYKYFHVKFNGISGIGNVAVTARGTCTLNGAVGLGSGSLTINGKTEISAPVSITAANQNYNGEVKINADTNFSTSGSLAFKSTVTGSRKITLSGTGSTNIGNNITLTGGNGIIEQAGSGSVIIDGSLSSPVQSKVTLTAPTQTYNGAVTVKTNAEFNAATALTFGSSASLTAEGKNIDFVLPADSVITLPSLTVADAVSPPGANATVRIGYKTNTSFLTVTGITEIKPLTSNSSATVEIDFPKQVYEGQVKADHNARFIAADTLLFKNAAALISAAPKKDVELKSPDVEIRGSVDVKNLTIGGADANGCTAVKFADSSSTPYGLLSGTVSARDISITLAKTGSLVIKEKINCAGFVQATAASPSEARVQIGHQIAASSVAPKFDAPFIFITDSATVDPSSSTGANSIDCKPDCTFFIAKNINLANTLSCGNFVLFGGTVTFGSSSGGITTTGDIVLFGSNYTANDTGPNDPSGVTGLFKYIHPKRTGFVSDIGYSAKTSLAQLPAALPDEGALPKETDSSPSFSGAFASLTGKTLKAGKNFYANGMNLAATGTWTLDIPNNDDATAAFAEAYFTTVSNCSVSGGGFVAAAEGCTVTSSSAWKTDRPLIKAYTVSDDTIYVRFVSSENTTQSRKIENTNNEIKEAVKHIKFSNNQYGFTKAYKDRGCTTSTNGQGDLSEFYIRIENDTQRWNTDATGTSPGDADSTCRGGYNGNTPRHWNNTVDLTIPKALSGLYASLRDEHKNRIRHYAGTTVDTSGDNGKRYGNVEDRCPPVLAAVYTGQEQHVQGSSQPVYDAHNFIEFRYSEPVYIGKNTPPSSVSVPETAQNILAENIGRIPNSSSGITVTGFASFSGGSIDVGNFASSNPSEQNKIHALYRQFSTTAFSVPSGSPSEASQKCRIRVSIAGYHDATDKWIGYIKSAETPSGNITVLSGADIRTRGPSSVPSDLKDWEKLDTTFTPRLYTASSGGSAYVSYHPLASSWDTSPPVFAVVANNRGEWNSGNTAKEIAVYSALTQFADKMEFHFFDNTPTFAPTESWWQTPSETPPEGQGWSDVAPRARYDSFGGSRRTGNNRTTGGIRACTLPSPAQVQHIFSFNATHAEFSSALEKFRGTDPDFTLSLAQKTENHALFGPLPSGFSEQDSLYLQLKITPISTPLAFPITETFIVGYQAFDSTHPNGGHITDLAGNIMHTFSGGASINASPPNIALTVAPVGLQQIYVLFTAQINTEPDTLAKIPHNLEIVDLPTGSSIAIDPAIAARVRTDTKSGTGVVISLTAPVSYKDLSAQAKLKVKDYGGSVYIRPKTAGYPALAGHRHVISDFAVNVIRPLFAYDQKALDGGNIGFSSQNLYGDGSYATRLFDGSGAPGNTVLEKEDITLNVAVENVVAGDPLPPQQLELYIDNSPNPASVSVDLNKAANLGSRVWLPKITTGLPPHTVSGLSVLSPEENTCSANEVILLSPTIPGGFNYTFNLRNNPLSPGSLNYSAGSRAGFLFALKNGGSYITIDHDCDNTTDNVPLYALRLKDPNDPASIDLWSFDIASIKKQAGGVSILNNVINANTGEQTLIKVDTEKAGSLSVMVMTLDGDVLKVLHSGRVEKGEHIYKWDGRNANGEPVARGLYFIRIVGPDIDETRKVMAVRE